MLDYPKKKKKNEPGRYNRRVLLIVVSLALIAIGIALMSAMAIGYWATEDILSESTINLAGDEALAQIEDTLKTTLPESAKDARYFYTSWLDFDLRLKFSLSADDVPAFLDSISHLCFEQPLQENLMPFVTSHKEKTWWSPGYASRYRGAPQCGDNPYWHLMVDQSNDETWRVFIEVFSI